jgi:hypothetical protein
MRSTELFIWSLDVGCWLLVQLPVHVENEHTSYWSTVPGTTGSTGVDEVLVLYDATPVKGLGFRNLSLLARETIVAAASGQRRRNRH